MGFSSVLNDMGRTIGELAYVSTPILLTGGVAENLGGTVPIILYTEAVALVNGLIAGGIGGSFNMPDLDNLWCHWCPVPNATLIANEIGSYPFANQTVAANAVISQPVTLTMEMICPARGPGAMATKLVTIQSLQAILNKHSTMGGTFTIMTPGQIYTNMLLTGFEDVSPHPEDFPASQFHLDFKRPLTQKSESLQKKGTLMSKLTGGSGGIAGWGSTGSGNIFENLLGGMGII